MQYFDSSISCQEMDELTASLLLQKQLLASKCLLIVAKTVEPQYLNKCREINRKHILIKTDCAHSRFIKIGEIISGDRKFLIVHEV